MAVKWVSVKEACRLLDISESTLRRRIKQGIIKAEGEGRERRVAVESDAEVTVTVTANEIEQLRKENEELHEQIGWLKEKLDQRDQEMAEAGHRHDTVVMQMTRLLEYHQQPFWRKLFSRKALPPPEQIMDMEPEEGKSKE